MTYNEMFMLGWTDHEHSSAKAMGFVCVCVCEYISLGLTNLITEEKEPRLL